MTQSVNIMESKNLKVPLFIMFDHGWSVNNLKDCPSFDIFESLIKWLRDNGYKKSDLFIDNFGVGLEIINKYLT